MSSDFTLPAQCRECVHRDGATAICFFSAARQGVCSNFNRSATPHATILARIDAEAARLVDGGYEITELVLSPKAMCDVKACLTDIEFAIGSTAGMVTRLLVGPCPPVRVRVSDTMNGHHGYEHLDFVLEKRRKSPAPPETCLAEKPDSPELNDEFDISIQIDAAIRRIRETGAEPTDIALSFHGHSDLLEAIAPVPYLHIEEYAGLPIRVSANIIGRWIVNFAPPECVKRPPETCGTCKHYSGPDPAPINFCGVCQLKSPMTTWEYKWPHAEACEHLAARDPVTAGLDFVYFDEPENDDDPITIGEPFTTIPYERSNIVTLFEYRIVTLDEDGVIVGMYADPPLDAEGEIFANAPETVVRKAIIRANVSEEELDSVKVLVRPFA